MVDVWWIRTDHIDECHYTRWYAMLDAREQDRARRFCFERDRFEFVACHALLRLKLSEFAGGPPHEWRFTLGPFGKPHVAPEHGRPELQFNISHARGLVAVAVTWQDMIGIDVEVIDTSADQQDLANRYFAPTEAELLFKTAPWQRPYTFARLWTLKEAYLKATGQGLNIPLDSFAFNLDPLRVVFGPDLHNSPDMWRFASSLIPFRHVLSVALHSSRDQPFQVTLQETSPQDL
jgi:4'-phosphopantetheinyl transferase